VSGLEVVRSLNRADQVRRQTELATAAIGPSGLITALQNERNFTGLWLLGATNFVDLPVDDMTEARDATDAAREAFVAEVEDKGAQVARIYGPGLAALDQIDQLRAAVDAYDGPHIVTRFNQVAEDSFLGYTEFVSALSDRTKDVITEVEDHELRRGVQLIDLASREVDTIARFVRVCLLGAVTGDRALADPAEISDAAMLNTQSLEIHYRTLDLAQGPYEQAGHDLAVESAATGLIAMGPRIIETGVVDIADMLDAISLDPDESYYGFIDDVSGILQARADELNAAAQERSRWYLAIALLVMGAAVIAILFVSRSIVRPLRQLTHQSIAMAERHLPGAVRKVLETPVGEDVDVPELAPIKVRTSDEVADVAATLNVVQSAALDLAVDQAMLRRNVADAFVNLARRNQNLISRQLDFITELERNETRTRTLENLFRLDHHATRMRRNAESLLVLAGVEASRQWGEPVSLVDVVRAAVGEVEDYRRVTITTMDTAMVVGSVASDLAHVTAELIENALAFSAPDVTVEVNGRFKPGHYLLLIIDEGIGMSPEDLEAANERLAHGTAFTVAPSRYLGHHVAGSLARRHGIKLRLHNTPCSGITAAVEIPTSLLTGSTLATPDGAHAQALRPGAPVALPAPSPIPADAVSAPAPAALAAADAPIPMPPAPAPAAPATSTPAPAAADGLVPTSPAPASAVATNPATPATTAGGTPTSPAPATPAAAAADDPLAVPPPRPAGPAMPTPLERKPAIWPSRLPAPAAGSPTNGAQGQGGGTNLDGWHSPADVGVVDLASRRPNGQDTGSGPPLARRVPGAQPPQTDVHSLHRPAAGGVAVAPDQEPNDMFRQLSQYADGLERGRHEHQD
jgi:signal transduction histidine kinase